MTGRIYGSYGIDTTPGLSPLGAPGETDSVQFASHIAPYAPTNRPGLSPGMGGVLPGQYQGTYGDDARASQDLQGYANPLQQYGAALLRGEPLLSPQAYAALYDAVMSAQQGDPYAAQQFSDPYAAAGYSPEFGPASLDGQDFFAAGPYANDAFAPGEVEHSEIVSSVENDPEIVEEPNHVLLALGLFDAGEDF